MATVPNAVDDATLLPIPACAAQPVSGLIRGLQLWHLLSLDAPSVAVLWTWFLARNSHIRLPAATVFAMGLAVWMLYAADRLLDARLSDACPNDASPCFADANHLEPRHHFHWRNRRRFRVGIALVSVALALLIPSLASASIRLYLILGALLSAYFLLIHADLFYAPKKIRRLPKELAVGVFFSAAVFIPTVAREPGLRAPLLPAALLFAVVCSLNCLFIYAWEHPGTVHPSSHPQNRTALKHLPRAAAMTALCGLLLAGVGRQLPWQIPAACAIAAAFLLLLHRNRSRLTATTLRAAADLCLLSPILLLPLLSH